MKTKLILLALLTAASSLTALATTPPEPLTAADRADIVQTLRIQSGNNQKYALLLPERGDYFRGLALGQAAAADFIEHYPAPPPGIFPPPLPTPPVVKPTTPQPAPSPIPVFSPSFRRF